MSYQYNKEFNPLSNEQLVKLAPSIGTDRPHSSTSNKYSFVPTLAAVDWMRKDGWLPTAANEVASKADHLKGFQRHVIRFSKKDLVLRDRRMEIALFNSHDGGSSFRLIAGLLEFLCANLCISGSNMAESLHRHVGFDGHKFVEAASNIKNYLENTSENIEKWETIELTPDEQGVYCRAAHHAVYGDEPAIKINPEHLLYDRRYNNKTDLWATFQNVQENVIKGGTRGRNTTGRRATTRAIKSIEKDRKINQALWMVTEHFAKYKMVA
jgi:hypothetical protein